MTTHSQRIMQMELHTLNRKKKHIHALLHQKDRQQTYIQKLHYDALNCQPDHSVNHQLQSSLQSIRESITSWQQQLANRVAQFETEQQILQQHRQQIAHSLNSMKSQQNELNSVRVRMLEIEEKMQYEPELSVRKCICSFLKDQINLESEFPYGIELTICRLNKIEQFKSYVSKKIAKSGKRQEQWKVYLDLLQQAQNTMQHAAKQQSYISTPIHKALRKLNQIKKKVNILGDTIAQEGKELKALKRLEQALSIQKNLQIQNQRQLKKKKSYLLATAKKKAAELHNHRDYASQQAEIEEAISYLQVKLKTKKQEFLNQSKDSQQNIPNICQGGVEMANKGQKKKTKSKTNCDLSEKIIVNCKKSSNSMQKIAEIKTNRKIGKRKGSCTNLKPFASPKGRVWRW